MIYEIRPIPNKYGVWCPLDTTLDAIPMMNQYLPTIGRKILIPDGLSLFKIMSRIGNLLLEHTVATDCYIDPIGLQYARHQITQQQRDDGGTFVPISVKTLYPSNIQPGTYTAHTYLFANAINFLLQEYRVGVPLDELNGNMFHDQRPSFFGETAVSPVMSMPDYIVQLCLRTSSSTSDLHNRARQWTMYNRSVFNGLTIEEPDRVVSAKEYLTQYGVGGGNLMLALADYHTEEYCAYERSEPANALDNCLKDFTLNVRLDPITDVFLKTPTYTYGAELRPFLDTAYNMQYNAQCNSIAMRNSFTESCEVWDMHVGEALGPRLWYLIETLVSIPDPEFTIEIDNANLEVVDFRNPTNRSISLPSTMQHLRTVLNELMFTPSGYNQKTYKILLTKLNTDEVFLTVYETPNSRPYGLYLNLGWYHLVSPSLVNLTELNQIV